MSDDAAPAPAPPLPTLPPEALGGLAAHAERGWVEGLPADPVGAEGGRRSREVRGAAYSWVWPERPPAPRLLAASADAGALLGLGAEELEGEDLGRWLSGAALLRGARPYATCYGGHQFGAWAGQLGDGRALCLGSYEGPPLSAAQAALHGVADPARPRWEVQLKGAGRTPYSRRGDGRAVLRSSLRELVCSEAMWALGVPTTRALSLVATGERVWRDPLYDGRPRAEPGAVVCRLAPSFLRFGHLELPASRGEWGVAAALLDVSVERDFAPAWRLAGEGVDALSAEERRARWFEEVSARTLRLMVEWTRVGFVHAVMNTDNLSALGLTVDYGPYGWLDDVDLSWTPNTSDAAERRYRFGAQPLCARWGLSRLAHAIAPLAAGGAPRLSETLEAWLPAYERAESALLARKVGFGAPRAESAEVLRALDGAGVDMTLFFAALRALPLDEGAGGAAARAAHLAGCLYAPEELPAARRKRLAARREGLWAWLERYAGAARAEVAREGAGPRDARLGATNPALTPRNFLTQEAVDAAERGDLSPLWALLEALRDPYAPLTGRRASFARRRPAWALERFGCSALSCSS
ncbi:MAG: YdiU family protein [Deltaproteobacteria bacterium]|nr:YdiU family protein [Deltaproteobacteria bacterium]